MRKFNYIYYAYLWDSGASNIVFNKQTRNTENNSASGNTRSGAREGIQISTRASVQNK